MFATRLLMAWVMMNAVALSVAHAQDDGPFPFVRFGSRADRVELDKTRGALDLQKPFTIELWGRWNTDLLDKWMYLAGALQGNSRSCDFGEDRQLPIFASLSF